MRVVLASKSPRRKEILNNIGVYFDIMESHCDETFDDNMSPSEIVMYLAHKKAKSIADRINDEALVIGADTIVVLNNRIMGKPKNVEESFEMLSSLSGNWHNVYSGISIIKTKTYESYTDFENTSVKIKELSDADIYNYISSNEPQDKAGAMVHGADSKDINQMNHVMDYAGSYAIQGLGSIIVESINGCYFNVVGLPVFKLSNLLKNFGMDLLKIRC